MIFLSHNFNDKPVVEQIALALRNIYGLENVFYDSWSIQPGEGIIDKMNQGLANCKFFFFFVSHNSLSSNMVKLEWQNALFRAAQNRIQFIPIRLDQSIMPDLLTQSLYIDLYTNGIKVAIRQIVDVINGNNTYRPPTHTFSNMVAYKYNEGKKVIIECHAKYFAEPISSFMFCTQQDTSIIKWDLKYEMLCIEDIVNDVSLDNGHITNTIALRIDKPTVPGFPFVVDFSTINDTYFDIEDVLLEKSRGRFEPIPIVQGKRIK